MTKSDLNQQQSGSEHRTRPAMCDACARPMDSAVACQSCGALNPLPPSMFTYFQLFGIEPTFDVDVAALRRKYLSLSRSAHPDAVGGDAEAMRQRALQLSAGLNRAYDTLADPVKRAEYLLSLAGGPDAAQDKSVPGELLGEVMMLREEIEEASEAGDVQTLNTMKTQIQSKQSEALESISRLCRSGELVQEGTQHELRQQLNAIKYWKNLLDQLPADVDDDR